MAHEQSDTRDRDDPARLADEARVTLGKQSAELRTTKVPIETESPTVYRP